MGVLSLGSSAAQFWRTTALAGSWDVLQNNRNFQHSILDPLEILIRDGFSFLVFD